jgi:hypothetical protein
MPKKFFRDARGIVSRLISGRTRRGDQVAELSAEIAALNRRIEIQDGDIAFAQTILARYTAEIEALMQENMSLRRKHTV